MERPPEYTTEDFAHSPFLIFWEVTRACDLVCRHCRASAHPRAHPRELDPEVSRGLIDQIAAFPKPPLLVLTGGDPMKRADLYDLIAYARERGLRVAITPSATELVTSESVPRLKGAGVSRFAMSIDGADAATHDAFRGVEGSFERTMRIIADARDAGLPVQVNTTITARNFRQVESMADLLEGLGIVLWSVFFLIPVGRGLLEQRIQPREYEEVFGSLWSNARLRPFGIKTTEAHHYRRYVLEQAGDPQRNPTGNGEQIQRAPLGVNDGKGVMFVSHTGQVYPSGFMPILCGRFPRESIIDVYQQSELFRSLRNGDLLKGKCGVCEYRHICGGSRARAYAVTGDPLGAEPDCVYFPAAAR
jgi:AdoMet-dependent heme synthase